MENVTVWEVLIVILIPSYCGGFLLLWNRQNGIVEAFQKELIEIKGDQNKLWEAVNESIRKLLEAKLENERHFIRRDSLEAIKKDIIGHIDTMTNALQDRMDRAEKKIDRLEANGDGKNS